MKSLIEFFLLILHYCLLPFSICTYLLVAINVCVFGEYTALEFAVWILLGCAPPWLCIFVGYLGRKSEGDFGRKMNYAHMIFFLLLAICLIVIVLLTPIKEIRILLILLYASLCLLPQVLLYRSSFGGLLWWKMK